MEWEEINLNDLLACCRRELALRQRVYPKWIAKGWMSEAKAEKELELMRLCVEFLVQQVFLAVVARKSNKGDWHKSETNEVAVRASRRTHKRGADDKGEDFSVLTAHYDRLLETITRRRALLHVQLMDDGAVITINKFPNLNAYLRFSELGVEGENFVAELDRTSDLIRSIRRWLTLIGDK
jgi:hypothetical protein